MNDLATLAYLGTSVGATAVTLLFVQFFKPVISQKLNTRLFTYIVALVLVVFVTAATGGSWVDYGLSVINAGIIALAAMGAYQPTFAYSDAEKKAGTE